VPLFSPIEALTTTYTAPYNHREARFRNGESAFHLASTILGGRDIIEEFVAAEIWPISYGWAPNEIVIFNVNWAAQEVPIPRFGLQLKEGQSADEFMDEIEKKVNYMIGESTMNEYKAYKNLVKHKRRINRVFSEISGEKSFCSHRPGLTVKISAVAVDSCSTAPLKALRGKSFKKGKKNTDETSSSVVHPAKTRSLESTKRKRKSSEVVSDTELQAATSLTQMSRKKTKKAVKKIAAAEVRRVPSAFDDDLFGKPSQKAFFSCVWPDLRFNVRRHCTPGSENEFVDIENFSDVVAKVRKEITSPVAAVAIDETADPRPSDPQDKAAFEFVKELEMSVHRGESPVQNAPLVETREDLPKDQDPSPSMIAFNKSFGTSYRGELLSVGYEKADARDDTSKLLTLWDSSKIVDETREGVSEQASPPLIGTPHDLGKQPSTSSRKTSSDSVPPSRVTVETLSRKGSRIVYPS
jgi:hypothetical protein